MSRMKLRQYVFIGTLCVLLGIVATNYFFRPFEAYFDVPAEEVTQIQEQERETVILTREDILTTLTTQEKIAQMVAYPLIIGEEKNTVDDGFMAGLLRSSDDAASVSAQEKESILEELDIESVRLDKLSPGFITVFGSEIASESAKQRVLEIKDLYRDNVLAPRFVVDHEGGTVQRLSGEGYTMVPSWRELCQLDDAERKRLLRRSANELRNSGIDIILAPVLDVGNSIVLKSRICSDSYAVVADRSVEFASIFNSFGILPVVKHFPGIGNVSRDLHNDFDSIDVLVNDVKLYKYVIEQAPRVAAMVSHVGVINQDAQVPCSLSASCVGELKDAYPQLLVFSDALEMDSASFNKDNISEPKDLVQVSKEAVLAGNEVLIYGQSVNSIEMKTIIFTLSKEYEANPEFKNLVDKALLKIVDYKYTRE